MDSRGIPGWDKVHRLAEALLALSHLYVTEAQAQAIIAHYDDLGDFDKQSLRFKPRPLKPSRGRFARSKGKRSSHVGVDHMKRYYFL